MGSLCMLGVTKCETFQTKKRFIINMIKQMTTTKLQVHIKFKLDLLKMPFLFINYPLFGKFETIFISNTFFDKKES